MASEAEILDVVTVLTGIYGKEPGDMRGFYWALADYDVELIERASQQWVKREKWMPAPAELAVLCKPMQDKRLEYWRHVQLWGDLVAGRRDDERSWKACREYFKLNRA